RQPLRSQPDSAYDRGHDVSRQGHRCCGEHRSRSDRALRRAPCHCGSTAMSFSPIAEIVADVRAGRMVVIADDEDRENEGDLIMAAEAVTPEAIAFIVRHSSGIICQPMTRERLEQLRLPQMGRETSESHPPAFTGSVDCKHGPPPGVSAHDRAITIRALADPSSKPEDFARPGHIFPLRYAEGGVLMRAGHTEASIDLVKLAGM